MIEHLDVVAREIWNVGSMREAMYDAGWSTA